MDWQCLRLVVVDTSVVAVPPIGAAGDECSAVKPIASSRVVPIVVIIGEAITDKAVEPAMVTAVKVVMPETLVMADATAPSIMIAPPCIVGVSPNRTTIVAEMSGSPIDGMVATPAAATIPDIGAATTHRDSATALNACSTAAHDVTASTSTETAAVIPASATTLRDIDAGATPSEAASAAAAHPTTAAAPRFGDGYSDYEP
jgi:hypothetical protein